MKTINYITVAFILTAFISCNEIFEDDISNQEVILSAPADSTITYNEQQTFWWEYVKGATHYNLQVVTPDFIKTEKMVLDTIIENYFFEYDLYPGIFQWRVWAMNYSSEVCSDHYTLIIKDSLSTNVRILILNTPADSVIVYNPIVTFWWEKIIEAESYNLQIVSPNFQNPETLILDTTINGNSCKYIVPTGEYQWRVNTIISSNEINSDIYSLFVVDTSNLNNITVNILSPADDFVSKTSTITLKWENISNVNNYNIQIKQNNWFNNTDIQKFETNDDSLVVELDEGIFYWGIKASNSSSETGFSIRKVMIDTTMPATPELVNPKINDTINQLPVLISWLKQPDEGSDIMNQILISEDAAFDTIIVDTTLNNSPMLLDTLIDGDYFMKIKSVDLAGNESTYTPTLKFVLINEE